MNYYDTYADALVERYERLDAQEVHSPVLDAIPSVASRVLDVGAGSGRDAAWLADRGHQVVAVEPSDQMRRQARRRHDGHAIQWEADTLPRLDGVYELGESFDLILLSAVWMHLAPDDRETAMRRLKGLLEPGGRMIISTRTASFTGERTLYRVDAAELAGLGEGHGLEHDRTEHSKVLLDRREVRWTTVVFRAPDDGTAALPTLRNIIVNDRKSSTYKLALLRILARIAAASPGMADKREDGFYDIPLGLVALTWAKTYWPLITDGVRQQGGGQTSRFRPELLAADALVSPYDIRIGRSMIGEAAQAVHTLLREVRDTIRDGPAEYTTYPGTDDPIFVYESGAYGGGGVSTSIEQLTFNPDYLRWFGALRVPAHIFEAMVRHWVWIEPTVINEWVGKMSDYEGGGRDVGDYYDRLYWRAEDRRDTRRVKELIEAQLARGESSIQGVWRGETITAAGSFHVDHCIPYSVWYNNSLWNLVPADPAVNESKSDRLPTAELLAEARPRFLDWWQRAFFGAEADEERRRRFAWEAEASLPGVRPDPREPQLGELFEGLTRQIGRMRRDQQIETWEG